MGSPLLERVRLDLLVYGNGIEENFRNNSLFFVDKYSKSDKMVTAISTTNMQPGGFYFLQYLDDSNWMKYSPVFMVEQRNFGNQVILMAVNLNFIPLEVRPMIFNPYISEDHFEDDSFLKVDYSGMYNELLKIGFEYSLMEYNAIQIKMVHKINMQILPRFLYSQHPRATYDPKKLMSIWHKKLETKSLRNQEMMKSMINEFYDINKDISEKYQVMKGHIERIQKSLKKYGGK
jgi:hypothetical protein